MQIRLGTENQERVEIIQAYFKNLTPISVELSATQVVTMALRDMVKYIESHGYPDEQHAAHDAISVVEEG